VLSEIARNRPKSIPVTVYSQVWDEFTIDEITSSTEELRWYVEPADAESLAELDARSGYRVEVTVPPLVLGGHFREQLSLSGRPDDQSGSPKTLELDVTASVLSRISVFGPKIDGGKVLRLGTLRNGEGAKERLIMKVRDDHRRLEIRRVETEPGFLRVRVAPLGQGTEEAGLYRIDVEVPPDAPASNFLSNKGVIRVLTDHPALPTLTLEVAFAVVGRRHGA
jgi:hypothetical protein